MVDRACQVCDVEKPLSEYGTNKKYPDHKAIICKACLRARSRKSYSKRRKKALQATKDWKPR